MSSKELAVQGDKDPIFLPIKAAALKMRLPYRVLLDAVNNGTVRHYRLGRSRRLVKVEDVIAAMTPNAGRVA